MAFPPAFLLFFATGIARCHVELCVPAATARRASAMLPGMKFIVWLIVGVVVFWVLRTWRRSRVIHEAPQERPVERMVLCDVCGINQPLGESLERDGYFYCCEEHARQGVAARHQDHAGNR